VDARYSEAPVAGETFAELDERSTSADARLRAAPTASRSGRGRTQDPLTTHIELVVVNGEEGEYLRRRQAAAIRRALKWLSEHKPTETAEPQHDEADIDGDV
jgi:hypothetical protein